MVGRGLGECWTALCVIGVAQSDGWESVKKAPTGGSEGFRGQNIKKTRAPAPRQHFSCIFTSDQAP